MSADEALSAVDRFKISVVISLSRRTLLNIWQNVAIALTNAVDSSATVLSGTDERAGGFLQEASNIANPPRISPGQLKKIMTALGAEV